VDLDFYGIKMIFYEVQDHMGYSLSVHVYLNSVDFMSLSTLVQPQDQEPGQ